MAKHGADRESLLAVTDFSHTGAQWLPGVRLLVVDDNEINREVAERILRQQGAEVVTCADGSEALATLKESPEKFDIVLMDVQMPNMDGNEAAARIRKDLGLTSLPIVALTAGALTNERDRSLNAGMDAFVSKPFEPPTLIRIVRRLVERRRGTPLAAQHGVGLVSAPANFPLYSLKDSQFFQCGSGNFLDPLDLMTKITFRWRPKGGIVRLWAWE